jgi:restriction system protein
MVNEDDIRLFVSTDGFTRDAERFARDQEWRKVTLIDLDKLLELWIQHFGKTG